MTGQPNCWLTDDSPRAAEELSKATGEPQSTFEPPGDVDYPDPDTLDAVPICHGAPYSGRKHEPVRMAPVERRDWFRCGQCGSRASVGRYHE